VFEPEASARLLDHARVPTNSEARESLAVAIDQIKVARECLAAGVNFIDGLLSLKVATPSRPQTQNDRPEAVVDLQWSPLTSLIRPGVVVAISLP
jgi:hypothetical protein